jgi:serine/threonine protein kinase
VPASLPSAGPSSGALPQTPPSLCGPSSAFCPRRYRAPEIMLGYHAYDHAIDMWSIGCIFGEMLLQQPVFPGNDYIHQLKLIVKLLGRPEESALWFVTNQNAMNFMLQLPAYTPQALSGELLPDAAGGTLPTAGKCPWTGGVGLGPARLQASSPTRPSTTARWTFWRRCSSSTRTGASTRRPRSRTSTSASSATRRSNRSPVSREGL